MTNPYGLDTLGLWDAIAELPEQIDTAIGTASDVLGHDMLPPPGDIRDIVVCGMGSSGLAGDVAAAIGATVPVVVVKDFDIPAFVGPDTLVFAVSWSGDTPETISAAQAALSGGATVVVISGGGQLGAAAHSAQLAHFALPADLPASRAAWAASVVPLLLSLSHLGVLPDVAPRLTEVATALSRRRSTLEAVDGPAAELARHIGRTIPLIHGSGGLAAVAARRWKEQINLNAKTPAFVAFQPELSHNEVAGWGQNGDVTRQILTRISLRHAGEHPGVVGRVAFVSEAVDEIMSANIEVWAEGDDDLTRMFDLVYFGDFVSLHVAGREGIDPGPVPAVRDSIGAAPSSDATAS